MTTVAVVMRDALMHLGVLDAEEAVEAVDLADGIRVLNRMMARWEANGLALGWTAVTSPDDVLPAPVEAEEAIGYNLAMRLRASYNATLSLDVVQMANDGLAALRRDVRVSSPLRFDRAGLNYDTYTDSYQ